MSEYKTIAESRNFIVLDQYTRDWQVNESYQSEGDLEREFIEDLVRQGYENPQGLNTPEALLANPTCTHHVTVLAPCAFPARELGVEKPTPRRLSRQSASD